MANSASSTLGYVEAEESPRGCQPLRLVYIAEGYTSLSFHRMNELMFNFNKSCSGAGSRMLERSLHSGVYGISTSPILIHILPATHDHIGQETGSGNPIGNQ